MIDRDVDVLIVGGGLMGAVLLLALTDAGINALLVDSKPVSFRTEADFDARSLALSPASTRILHMLHVWPLLEKDAAEIEMIHISEQHRFGQARLHGNKGAPLGHVVEMQHLSRALYPLLDHDRMITPAQLTAFNPANNEAVIHHGAHVFTVRARLVVAADGADSSLREHCGLQANRKDYAQHAIVANIGLARGHQAVAYERFTPSGPLALLPMTGSRSALVWSLPPDDAARLMQMSEEAFLKALQQAFGYRLGRFIKVGQRTIYPLRQVTMSSTVCGSVVFVGNAAHTLHPVAGQGFNLGLRDVAMLAQCIVNQGINDSMLQHYQASRQHDQVAITRFTDGLIELFTSRLPGVALARGAGLVILDNVPFFKNMLARYARGFAGITPDLVCGIPLRSMP